MQKTVTYILFTESPTGFHTPKDYDKGDRIINITGTFLPFYDEVDEKWKFTGKQLQQFKTIFKDLKKEEYFVMIGYDFDENGQFMAEILKDMLISIGVEEARIFRTPITEKKYILISEFPDLTEYKQFRKIDFDFIKRLKANKNIKKPVGILKAIGIYMLNKNKEKEFRVNTEGTSTITYLYKYKTEED